MIAESRLLASIFEGGMVTLIASMVTLSSQKMAPQIRCHLLTLII